METSREYHYTYYSYEEWGMGYFGSRSCSCLPEEDVNYFGSFSDKNFHPTYKIILKSDYKTREEATSDEIILHNFYEVDKNPHFANKSRQTSTKFYFGSKEHSKKIGSNNALLKKGFCGMSQEQRVEVGRKGGLRNKENKTGFFKMSKEEKSELGRRNSKNNKKNKKGIFKLTSKELSKFGSKGGEKTISQRWKCLVTGHISNPGGLTLYQKKRCIDTSQRVRVE